MATFSIMFSFEVTKCAIQVNNHHHHHYHHCKFEFKWTGTICLPVPYRNNIIDCRMGVFVIKFV